MCHGGGPKGVGPNREKMGPRSDGAPKGGAPKGGGPKISRVFRLPLHLFDNFISHSVSSRGFLVVFGSAGRQMFTFGVLGLSCEAPAAPKPPGFHTTTREPERAH